MDSSKYRDFKKKPLTSRLLAQSSERMEQMLNKKEKPKGGIFKHKIMAKAPEA
jgi:hypothetical protein